MFHELHCCIIDNQNIGEVVTRPYGPVCPEAHKEPRSSLRAQSNGFPKERFLSIVLTRIYTKSGVHKSEDFHHKCFE